MFFLQDRNGFTLVEILVVLGIIGILAAAVFVSFSDTREAGRDAVRQSTLSDLRLAIERYRAENGEYPPQGCGDSESPESWAGPGVAVNNFNQCENYILGLTPDYMNRLPANIGSDLGENEGIFYSTDGASYKLMMHDNVEIRFITEYSDPYARCPYPGGPGCPDPLEPPERTYAVYSLGAENW